MVAELRVNVTSVMKELETALAVLTEAKIPSRYRRIFKGKGLEFEDFRKYTTDDDATRIDWKASVRANKLLIREFREERDINVFFLVDVSSSMLFGSTPKLKHEYAAELVAALAYFIVKTGDKVGLVMFTDEMVSVLLPSKGTSQFYIMLNSLLKPDHYGGGYDLTKVLDFMLSIVKERSLMFLVSDFIGLKPGWERKIRLASVKFDGVAVMVRDPRDVRLPQKVGQVVIADPFSSRELLIDCDNPLARKYEEHNLEQHERVKKVFKEGMWDTFELTTDENFVLPILKFMRRREILSR